MNRLLSLLCIAAAAVALSAASAGAATSYADAVGDSGTAPDIGAVNVTNGPDGQLTFQIGVANEPDLAADAQIYLLLDTDLDGSTGSPDAGGADYLFALDGATHSYGLERWDGSAFVSTPSSTVTATYANGAFISVNRSELGGTSAFGFWARTTQGPDLSAGHVDDAPDSGWWTYLLSVGQSGLYNDTAGDSGTAADIGAVSVSNNESGQISFQVDTTEAQQASDGTLFLLLDTDENPATGNVDAGGAEYVYVRDGETSAYGFGHWDGTQFDYTTPSTTAASRWGGGASFTVNRSELGNASGFNLWVRTVQGDDPSPGHLDDAPDAGTWNYQLAGAPAPPTAPREPAEALTLDVVRVFARPAAPVPGALFTVFAEVLRSDTGDDLEDGVVTCKATVGRRRIAVSHAGFLKGTPACTFRVPAKSKGKMLRGSLAVVAEGARGSKTFSYRVGAPKRRTAAFARAWHLSTRTAGLVLGAHPPAAADMPWLPPWLA